MILELTSKNSESVEKIAKEAIEKAKGPDLIYIRFRRTSIRVKKGEKYQSVLSKIKSIV